MSESRGRVWTGVLRVGPARGDHRVAVRAAVCVAVPLLVLWMLGRLDLSVYASFGAFAALYGRHDVWGDRVRMQAAAGGALVVVMLIGTSLSWAGSPAVVKVLVIAALASAMTLVSHLLRWHPPGPLFPVFAAGATATIPATAQSFASVLVVGGASMLFALAVTVGVGLAARRPRRAVPPPRPRLDEVAWEMTATVGAATLAAGAAGLLLTQAHWYWAMVGAVAAVGGPHVTARVIRGVQRLAGTLLGVLLAAGLLALDLPPLAVIGAAVALQAAAELFIGRNYGIAMVFVTPLALLMIGLAAPTPPDVLLRDRTIETILGVAIGTVVAVASARIRRRRSRPSHPPAHAG